MSENMIHFRYPLKWLTVCGLIPTKVWASVSMAHCWPEVTCTECLGERHPKFVPGTPERHQEMIAECRQVERECADEIDQLSETQAWAFALRGRLERLCATETAQNASGVGEVTPGEFLRDLRGYAVAQRAYVRPTLAEGGVPTWKD